MAAAFFAFLLAAFALLAIVGPLAQRIGRADGRPSPTGESWVQRLLDQRETSLRGIKELENDHALGNLGGEEYRLLRTDYEREVAAVLRELDSFEPALDEQIEVEIAAIRASLNDGDQSTAAADSTGVLDRTSSPTAAPGKAGR